MTDRLQILPGDGRVLDACCGSRMFWFDKQNPDALYIDTRREDHNLCDGRALSINPDMVADFTALPFPDGRFALVVFDPPHLVRAGRESWMAKKYGRLVGDWEGELRKGFAECFRVLQSDGVLVFKWNEGQVPVSKILNLTDVRPLVGNRCGKSSKSHWIVFLKPLESGAA
jgi:SAM-dependent methyltransferase